MNFSHETFIRFVNENKRLVILDGGRLEAVAERLTASQINAGLAAILVDELSSVYGRGRDGADLAWGVPEGSDFKGDLVTRDIDGQTVVWQVKVWAAGGHIRFPEGQVPEPAVIELPADALVRNMVRVSSANLKLLVSDENRWAHRDSEAGQAIHSHIERAPDMDRLAVTAVAANQLASLEFLWQLIIRSLRRARDAGARLRLLSLLKMPPVITRLVAVIVRYMHCCCDDPDHLLTARRCRPSAGSPATT